MALDRETILRDLHDLGAAIGDLEAELKPLRDKRNRRILRAIELGIPEWTIVRSGSGITRGFIWKLKLKHGLVDPQNRPQKYHKSRSSGAQRAST